MPCAIHKHWGGKDFYRQALKTSDHRAAEKEVRAICAIMDAQLEKAKAKEGWQTLTHHLPPDQKTMLDDAG